MEHTGIGYVVKPIVRGGVLFAIYAFITSAIAGLGLNVLQFSIVGAGSLLALVVTAWLVGALFPPLISYIHDAIEKPSLLTWLGRILIVGFTVIVLLTFIGIILGSLGVPLLVFALNPSALDIAALVMTALIIGAVYPPLINALDEIVDRETGGHVAPT